MTTPTSQPPPESRHCAPSHLPSALLICATVFWGTAFTWAKTGGDAVNAAAGLPDNSLLGPIWLLFWRFLPAGLLVLAVIPAARRGWTWRSVGRAAWLGLLLGAGIHLQHTGLDRTSEALSAFLTSLTILFVPLLQVLLLRRMPAAIMWIGIAVASLGVAFLVAGEARASADVPAHAAALGPGVLLGLGSAMVLGLYIVEVNRLVPRDNTWRMLAGQWLGLSVVTLAVLLIAEGGPQYVVPPDIPAFLSTTAPTDSDAVAGLLDVRTVAGNLLVLIIFPTIGSFTILTRFQPCVTPTRAALIYLAEPVWASAYAWLAVGREIGLMIALGGVLILLSNGLVEFYGSRRATAGP